MLTVEIAKKEQRHRGFESLQNHRTNRMYPNEIVCNKYFDVTGVITQALGGACNLIYDTVSNLAFWSHLANKLEPWHNVYIIQQ